MSEVPPSAEEVEEVGEAGEPRVRRLVGTHGEPPMIGEWAGEMQGSDAVEEHGEAGAADTMGEAIGERPGESTGEDEGDESCSELMCESEGRGLESRRRRLRLEKLTPGSRKATSAVMSSWRRRR